MGFGFGALRLAPGSFWRMTLPELSAAAEMMFPADRAQSRKTFAALMKRFPDRGAEGRLSASGRGGA
jgi:uncharacterized phage protein (TIGR02216 family)